MKDATYIAVLLDRSGSMGSIKEDTIGGFNQFVNDQKQVGDNAMLTLVQFDTQGVDTIHESKPIKDVPDLTSATYQPRGGTPLLDALGKTICSTGKVLESIPEPQRPDKIVFVVITDGQENSSREYSKSRVKEMIEHQSSTYQWNFVYLGANQDAFAEAGGIGITMDNAATFDVANMRDSYAAASANMKSYRRSGSRSALRFSSGQRERLIKKT